jgi:uncharacterized damage-inducible protein DinB
MSLTDHFTAQLERESAICRRVLERVPEGSNDWLPHEKSMALGYLATLVATMPSWVAMAIDQDELDLAPPGGSGNAPPEWRTVADLHGQLDEATARARAALDGSSDEHLETPWRLLVGGDVVMESPREVVIADTFCHLAHHRGQLSVYLRLLDIPVPSIYGPSADDERF